MNNDITSKEEEQVVEEQILKEEDTNSNDDYYQEDDYNDDNSNQGDFRSKIIRMFGIVLVALIVILVVGFIVSLFTKKDYTYSSVEDVMKDAAIEYFKDNKSKLPKDDIEIVEISSKVLVSNNYMKSIDKYIKNSSCSGKVSVAKTGSKSYSYTPVLTCKDYKTIKFYDEVTSEKNIVNTGFGLYKMNSEYVYRGSKVNNYVRFSDSEKLWRIVKATSNNEVVLISEDRSNNVFSFDERYNNRLENNYGLNSFINSNMSNVLLKLYDNTLNSDEDVYYNREELEILTKQEKSKLVEFNSCVGTRSKTDTTKTGVSECSSVVKTKLSILPVYDFLNASLDSNCDSALKPDCQNYNYLVTNYNYWLLTGVSEDNSRVYRVSSLGYIQDTYAKYEAFVRSVIYVGDNAMLEKGKGTKNDPYVIR